MNTVSLRPPKPKPFPLPSMLGRLAQNAPAILAINWLSQGMRGMDRKELTFRLALEAALTIAFATATGGGAVGWIIAWLAAHTFGFTVNGQLWVCARYARSWRRDPAALVDFVDTTAALLAGRQWLDEALIIGSFGGVATDARSDIDLRLIFPRGRWAWLRTNLLLLRLRATALMRRIPLDLYAYDDLASLRRFDQREALVVLLDRGGRLACAFPNRVRLWP